MAKGGTVTFDFKGDASDLNKNIKSISKSITSGFKIASKAITVASSALSALGGFALKVGSEFEYGMSEVSAISGATGKDLQALKEKAQEMGATTKFSATESAEALKYMAMAGWKTTEMTEGLAGIMNLAAASGEDLAVTSDIVTDALTAFGMKASESSHFADILAVASSNSNTNVAMMGETFKYAASIAGSLGYTAEDTALAIGLMANAGIKASQAGTSLRSIMSRLATNTGGARDAIEELGIAVVNSDGTMRDFGSVISDIRTEFKDLSAEEQSNYAKTIAGQEALSGFLAIANSGEADFNKLRDSIANCDGTAQQMADTMNDNLSGQTTLLKSNIESLGLTFYEKLEAPAKGAVKGINGAITELSNAFKSGGINGFANELGTQLANGISSISTKLPEFINLGTEVVNSLIQGINNNLPNITLGISNIIVSLANGFTQLLPQILNMLILGLISISEQLLPQLPTIFQNLINGLLNVGDTLVQQLPTLIPKIVRGIIGLLEVFNQNFDKFLLMGAKLILGLIQGLINSIPDILSNLPTIIMAILNFFTASKLLSAGMSLIKGLANGLVNGIPNIIKNIPKIIGSIVNGIKDNGIKSLGNVGKMLVQGLWNGIKNAKQWVIDKIKGLGNAVLKAIKGIFGIHSPSTEFAWIGKMNILGLEKGMEDMKGDLNTTFDDMMNLSPTMLASASNSYNPNVNVVVNNSFEQDPLGQIVQKQKNLAGGSKNDYNFGLGG